MGARNGKEAKFKCSLIHNTTTTYEHREPVSISFLSTHILKKLFPLVSTLVAAINVKKLWNKPSVYIVGRRRRMQAGGLAVVISIELSGFSSESSSSYV